MFYYSPNIPHECTCQTHCVHANFGIFICFFVFFFFQSYIPSTLNQVTNVEADVLRLTSGEDTEDLYYKTITGLRQALSSVPPSPPETEIDSGSDEENSSDSLPSFGIKAQEPLGKKVARKENKKKVKEEKREARKHKLPKAVKKRRKKLANGGKTR